MRRSLLALPLAVAMLTGCSSGSGTKAAVEKADSRAVVGGELRVGIIRPATIDPQLVATEDTAAALVVRTMCDSLLSADPQTRELAPAVAASWKLLGATSVQLTLRKDLRFSDGSKVEAKDAIAALQRVVNPDVVSPQSKLLDNLLGYPDVQDGKTDARSIPALKLVGSDTLQVVLYKKDSQFISALTLPLATPIPRRLAKRASFSQHPICVGPYRLVGDYTGVETSIRLERTPGYAGLRPGLTRNGQGWADRITFRIFPTRAAALAGLRAGSIDAAQLGSGEVVRARLANLTVASATSGRLEYVGLPNRAPFDNPLVQAALSRALDRTVINSMAFQDTRTPAYNLVPPSLPDSVLPKEEVRRCGMPANGDLAEAKQLLKRAGVDLAAATTKTPLKFYYNDEFDNAKLMRAVTVQWLRLGVHTEPVKVSFENLLARAQGTGGFDGAFRMTTTAEFADQGDFVRPLVSIDDLGTSNFTGYNGLVLVRSIDEHLRAAVPVDDQRVQSLSVTAATCAVPVIPIAWYQNHLGLGTHVVIAANGAVNEGAGFPELRELSVG